MSKSLVCLSPLILLIAAPVYAMDSNGTTEVTIYGQRNADLDTKEKRTDTSDVARLFTDISGVSLQSGGGVSSRPVIHGLDDDRIRITMDGMDLTSACANHMNPALSYASPYSADSIGIQAGVTPVSLGGDSLGGTITVKSAPPLFAETPDTLLITGDVSLFYRSNAENSGSAMNATLASDRLSFRLDAGVEDAADYKDGNGRTVTSTYYKTRDLAGTFAYRQNGRSLTLRVGARSVPGQGFANQQMDMIKNTSNFGNLNYQGDFGWGHLEAVAYAQTVHHLMNIGKDKLKLDGTMMMPDMPMNTRGEDSGLKISATIPAKIGKINIGSEYHHFGLDDWWPPVEGTMMMAPNTFFNINDGRRDRTSLYTELESRLSDKWSTLAGLRADHIVTDTHDVSGYNMMYAAAANAFNATDHKRSDTNWDATFVARYTPDTQSRYEFALTRKSRAPNLYERYAWGTDWMSSVMVNWAGDGNAYVGNQNLKPEVAHTVMISGQWQGAGENSWMFRLTPYYTQVDDFINVRVNNSKPSGEATLNQLQFVNEDAALYGFDAHFTKPLWNSGRFGSGNLHVIASYVHGENIKDKTPLYHMMPLNGRMTLEQVKGNWKNAVELEAVSEKTRLDPERLEPKTNGYALINLRSAYQWKAIQVSLSVTNLLNTDYALPLGGVSVDDFLATNWMGRFEPLKGAGRSINITLSRHF
ncbi:MAG: TonB-dependent receptor [Asticcacaulis sp.]